MVLVKDGGEDSADGTCSESAEVASRPSLVSFVPLLLVIVLFLGPVPFGILHLAKVGPQNPSDNCVSRSHCPGWGGCVNASAWVTKNCYKYCTEFCPTHGKQHGWDHEEFQVANDEGETVARMPVRSVEECQQSCDSNEKCQSFTMCNELGGLTCNLKSKKLDGAEPTHYNKFCTSWYQTAVAPTDATPLRDLGEWVEMDLVKNEGDSVALPLPLPSIKACQDVCDRHLNCRSFAACGSPETNDLVCHLKALQVFGSEKTRPKATCKTHFKYCGTCL
eukprot:TRINITY_DN65623_c0_g1_i1.p1 TRINITY_DN65623_c0_g1~~TRINITY_DN65623_c0_g1_i1.p1  ORF type:complete len:277 (-),score=23.41 TRINITY_DN65623_c0_g1_i1:159-989(-)